MKEFIRYIKVALFCYLFVIPLIIVEYYVHNHSFNELMTIYVVTSTVLTIIITSLKNE